MKLMTITVMPARAKERTEAIARASLAMASCDGYCDCGSIGSDLKDTVGVGRCGGLSWTLWWPASGLRCSQVVMSGGP